MYDSLRGLLKKRDSLSKLMIELKLPVFKEVELEFLDEYCLILEPIALALDRLQGDKNCFYADLAPTLFKVSNQLSTLHSMNWHHCLPLLNAVTSGFNRRFAEFLQLNPEVNQAILATITHPYFKLRWLPQSMNNQRNRLQALFVSEAKRISQSTPHETHTMSNSVESDDDYFGFRPNASESTNATTDSSSTDIVGELEALQYLEDSRKDLTMLNNYPTIKQLFLHYNATLPSSAPVERLFSFAGIITRPHRRKLCDKLFEKLLLLKNN